MSSSSTFSAKAHGLTKEALLFVGKAGIGGRMHKVAVVPKIIRTGIVKLLE